MVSQNQHLHHGLHFELKRTLDHLSTLSWEMDRDKLTDHAMTLFNRDSSSWAHCLLVAMHDSAQNHEQRVLVKKVDNDLHALEKAISEHRFKDGQKIHDAIFDDLVRFATMTGVKLPTHMD